MIDANIWKGVQSFLDHYLQLRADDRVILTYTSDSHEVAAWLSVALQLRNVGFDRVWMAPLHDVEFGDRLAAALPDPHQVAGRLVFVSLELDTLSHDELIRSALSKYDKDRTVVYRIISACASLFTDALTTTPDELSARNATILERCMGKKRLRVKTDGGTDLRIELDSEKHRWISNRGVWRQGSSVLLPAGEVATFPASIEGVLVADFAFNLNVMTKVDARLDRHPVTVWIEKNRAVRYECKDEFITKFLDECFGTHCAHIVGELGLGTNAGVKTPISLNSHINERHCGIHLGFGESNQPPSVVGYTCQIHLDLISRGGMVWVDDDPEPIDLQNIRPSSSPHPTRTLDEDATSPGGLVELEIDDCCGILTRDGLKLWRDPYSENWSEPLSRDQLLS